jgi:hypothetical protein
MSVHSPAIINIFRLTDVTPGVQTQSPRSRSQIANKRDLERDTTDRCEMHKLC